MDTQGLMDYEEIKIRKILDLVLRDAETIRNPDLLIFEIQKCRRLGYHYDFGYYREKIKEIKRDPHRRH